MVARTGIVVLVLGVIVGCAGKPAQRQDISCRQSVDSAYQGLNYAKSKGFAGSVSYSKAAGLLAAAKVQQQLENYRDCIAKANKANFYIRQSQNQ